MIQRKGKNSIMKQTLLVISFLICFALICAQPKVFAQSTSTGHAVIQQLIEGVQNDLNYSAMAESIDNFKTLSQCQSLIEDHNRDVKNNTFIFSTAATAGYAFFHMAIKKLSRVNESSWFGRFARVSGKTQSRTVANVTGQSFVIPIAILIYYATSVKQNIQDGLLHSWEEETYGDHHSFVATLLLSGAFPEDVFVDGQNDEINFSDALKTVRIIPRNENHSNLVIKKYQVIKARRQITEIEIGQRVLDQIHLDLNEHLAELMNQYQC